MSVCLWLHKDFFHRRTNKYHQNIVTYKMDSLCCKNFQNVSIIYVLLSGSSILHTVWLLRDLCDTLSIGLQLAEMSTLPAEVLQDARCLAEQISAQREVI